MRRFSTRDAAFASQLTALLAAREAAVDVRTPVSTILADVRERGDAALMDYTEAFDRFTLTPDLLPLPASEIAAAKVEPEVEKALHIAAERIADYASRQMPQDHRYTDSAGVTLGWQWKPLASAGLYVPGGKAAYPSSVLMNAVVAKTAGVTRLAMVVPMPDGIRNPAVLVAARIAGVSEIYPLGGAQAVAALAYGTESVARVAKIVGPGNAYVAEAKRQVFGTVGIDMIAGPSEILVVADSTQNPAWVAADLLSQAEHDADAQSILITDSAEFADRVEAAIATHLTTLARAAIARESLQRHGAVLLVPDFEEAIPLIDRIAPEHLELLIPDATEVATRIRHAGAVFIGAYATEPLGDYLAGPSHVLPTSGTARFSSGLSVYDFLIRSSWIEAHAPTGLESPAAALARAEGLTAHALALDVRNTTKPFSRSVGILDD
jgi:histidinol dehydrogenase